MPSTIAAISTPQGVGGISVIRISGERAVEIADRVFRSRGGKKLGEIPGYTALYGDVFDGETKIDEAVALKFCAPHSYTGEDVVELSCHGGLFVTRRLLRAVLNAGASASQAGEFTKRAYLNGKLSLDQAEAVMDIISARGESQAKAALFAREGALSGKIQEINRPLLLAAAALSAWVDYPDEDIPDMPVEQLAQIIKEAITQAERLLGGFDRGRILRDGAYTVIAGSPNVGKSTLMNLLAGCERSIVTAVPGTTRDVVEETVDLNGILLRLSDTAGLRKTEDEVESIGIARTKRALSEAELVIAVFDASRELSGQDMSLLREIKSNRCVAVINKTDLPCRLDESLIRQNIQNVICVSALRGQGIDGLRRAIENVLGLSDFDPAAAQLFGERQYNCVSRAKESLTAAEQALRQGFTYDAVAIELDEAIGALLELTGERVTDKVVDEIFANFCVGK